MGSPVDWKVSAENACPEAADRIDAGRVVDEVGVEARFLNLRRREVARELVDDRADHLHMRQFLGAYIVLRNVPY